MTNNSNYSALLSLSKISLLLCFPLLLKAQLNEQNSSSTIEEELKKLTKTTSVLYIAAHPDDENTRLISWFGNEAMARTAYLSLTRGDGGQNLIGTEKGKLLGLLRTQELLAARKIDGGEQYFTRAIDFGYSKTADETFEFWEKEKILHDVVLIIRKFKPDVIVTRFPADGYGGHGHHVASAILANEAFEAAADSKRFTEHFEDFGLEPWQATRLYFNTSSWWNKDLPEQAKNSDEFVTIDVGTYNPVIGMSYNELAAESRSQHKSQGFGAARQRGSSIEYLKHVKGMLATNNDILSNVTTDWSRFGEKGIEIQKKLVNAQSAYNPNTPVNTILSLVEARKLMDELEDGNGFDIIARKKDDLDALLLKLSGIHTELTVDEKFGVPGETKNFELRFIHRSDLPVRLKSVKFLNTEVAPESNPENNVLLEQSGKVSIPANHTYTNPYWLEKEARYVYEVSNIGMIGEPMNTPVKAAFEIKIKSHTVILTKPVQHRWVDREKGELYSNFYVVPPITAKISEPVYIFANDSSESISVKVSGHQQGISGKVNLKLPEGWQSEPESIDFNFEADNSEEVVQFSVTPPKGSFTGEMGIALEFSQKMYNQSLNSVSYDHIEPQILLEEAKSTLNKLDIAKKGKNILYVMGSGDEIPENLRQIGYQVEVVSPDEVLGMKLEDFDALLIGIRAYNTDPQLANSKAQFMEYVKNGGKLIVQYQTSRRFDANDFSPYNLVVTRDRVTDENAEVRFNDSKHPLLNTPNKLTQADFSNWVQERGLYFAGEWSEEYQPIISWNDKGETEKLGGLLVAQHGEGAVIYTGISFFRQLPAGVPGAFRLFANILSYSPGYVE